MLRAKGISNGLICDLGCGAGPLSAALLQAGYDVQSVGLRARVVAGYGIYRLNGERKVLLARKPEIL